MHLSIVSFFVASYWINIKNDQARTSTICLRHFQKRLRERNFNVYSLSSLFTDNEQLLFAKRCSEKRK